MEWMRLAYSNSNYVSIQFNLSELTEYHKKKYLQINQHFHDVHIFKKNNNNNNNWPLSGKTKLETEKVVVPTRENTVAIVFLNVINNFRHM